MTKDCPSRTLCNTADNADAKARHCDFPASSRWTAKTAVHLDLMVAIGAVLRFMLRRKGLEPVLLAKEKTWLAKAN